MRERVIDKSLHRVTEYASTENFLAASAVPAGISTIWEKGLPIDVLVSPASSDTTIFFFHGAIERHFTLPVLSGLGISGAVNANRVFVSDPSLVLDDSLMLAWYAGNSQQPDLQETLTHILRKIAGNLGSKKVVFFGGSGGGFASLYFASRFEDSLALVFNPQTNIAKYTESAIRDFAVKGFGVNPEFTDPLSHLPPEVTTDVCKIYATPRRATVTYLQNQNDAFHVDIHLSPFIESLHKEVNFLLLTEAWRDGHSPPPKELLTQALDVAASSNNWASDFSAMGFKQHFQDSLLE